VPTHFSLLKITCCGLSFWIAQFFSDIAIYTLDCDTGVSVLVFVLAATHLFNTKGPGITKSFFFLLLIAKLDLIDKAIFFRPAFCLL
jgi:hypothetical protein